MQLCACGRVANTELYRLHYIPDNEQLGGTTVFKAALILLWYHTYQNMHHFVSSWHVRAALYMLRSKCYHGEVHHYVILH